MNHLFCVNYFLIILVFWAQLYEEWINRYPLQSVNSFVDAYPLYSNFSSG